jgi:hypothetical protein
MLRLSSIPAIVLAVVICGSGQARAYPQWQLSAGTVRCNQCHFAPGGGGLINGYGRDAAGEDLSTFQGSGEFLHGAVQLPSWLALGGDFRGAFVAHDAQDPAGPKRAFFPMQADLYARVAIGGGWSVQATGGLRGQVRRSNALIPEQNYQPITSSRLISREHFVMWQPQPQGPYVRAGRFYAPFGLRLAEHVIYVRRDLGFNVLEETYNVSAGFVRDDWEMHVTGFAPDFLRHIGGRDKGAAVYFERRLLDYAAALGLQSKLSFGEGSNRWIVGGVGKAFVAPLRTLLLAEANVVRQFFASDAVGARNQLVGAAGAAVLPARGIIVTLLAERSHVDLQVRDSAWNAATGLLSWFPYPHFELQAMGRLQFPAGGDVTRTFFFQLHYYL